MLSKVLSIIALTATLVLIINTIGLIIHLACLLGNVGMNFPITLLTWLTIEYIAFTILFTTLFIMAIAD